MVAEPSPTDAVTFSNPAPTAASTYAVVATAVELSAADCVVAIVPVGKVGVPVNVGESSGALSQRLVETVVAKFASSPSAAANS